MDPTLAELEAMRMQVQASLIEHHIVVQALYGVCIVCFVAVGLMGLLSFFLWRRTVCLSEALIAEVERHSKERIGIVKQNSLERESAQMQMLHAFEGIASRKARGSGKSSTT